MCPALQPVHLLKNNGRQIGYPSSDTLHKALSMQKCYENFFKKLFYIKIKKKKPSFKKVGLEISQVNPNWLQLMCLKLFLSSVIWLPYPVLIAILLFPQQGGVLH